jgi:predicted PurR-regulated permease PerM
MLGYIIKLVFIVIVVMIGLNIYSPQRVDQIISTVSETTQIEESTLKNGLDKATLFTQDTANEISETVKKNLDI